MVGRTAVWFLAMLSFAAANPLPEGAGKKILQTACASCHGLDTVAAKKLSKQEWQGVVKSMIDRGASLTKEESAAVVSYLARNFGNKEPARELFEDICSYCHNLERVKDQELTKEQWRDLIKGMISEGAPVTDEEFSIIVDYLAKNFGKRNP